MDNLFFLTNSVHIVETIDARCIEHIECQWYSVLYNQYYQFSPTDTGNLRPILILIFKKSDNYISANTAICNKGPTLWFMVDNLITKPPPKILAFETKLFNSLFKAFEYCGLYLAEGGTFVTCSNKILLYFLDPVMCCVQIYLYPMQYTHLKSGRKEVQPLRSMRYVVQN